MPIDEVELELEKVIAWVREQIPMPREEAKRVYSKAAKAAYWTCEEAAALTMCADPRIFIFSHLRACLPNSMLREYSARTELLRRKFEDHVPADELLSWAVEVEIPLPPELPIAIEAAKSRRRRAGKSPSGETRQLRNALQVIAGLAVLHYGYNPSKRNPASKQIAIDLEEIGIPAIKEDAVRGYLSEAADDNADALTAAAAHVAELHCPNAGRSNNRTRLS